MRWKPIPPVKYILDKDIGEYLPAGYLRRIDREVAKNKRARERQEHKVGLMFARLKRRSWTG